MKPLKNPVERAIAFLRPAIRTVRPSHSANDNTDVDAMRAYIRSVRKPGSADYVPSGAKAWWLP